MFSILAWIVSRVAQRSRFSIFMKKPIHSLGCLSACWHRSSGSRADHPMDRAGRAGRRPTQLSAREEAEIAAWERFLNGDSLKERLMSRYLYEHLFLAHLYLNDAVEGPAFRLVRSATPPRQPISSSRRGGPSTPQTSNGLLSTAARS